MSLQIFVRRLQIGNRCLIQNLQIECPAGTVTTLMGASGSGKSSLLAAVAGTLTPNSIFDGEVLLSGVRIDQFPPQIRHVGILFQDDLLFAHMNVLENLLFAVPRTAGATKRQHREQATHFALQALSDAELDRFSQSNPATLSGGQRARVSLLRALMAEPNALLLDEPFSKLDLSLRSRFKEFVFAQCKAREIPTLLVTHDPSDIADAERVITLESLTHA